MSLEGHAEVMKFARLVGAEPERFDYLEQLSPVDVRALRERATVVLYEGDRRLGRVALAARIPPVAMTAWIAQHLFGPLLCARVAGLLDIGRAVGIAKRLPPAFIADLAMELDPRRARDIIFALPPQLIGKVADVLTRRGEVIVMGRFVGHMPDASLRAAFKVIDDESLLRISYFVEEKDQLDHVVGLLEPERLSGAIRSASEADLWPQALDLLTRVSPEQAGWLADLAADEEDYVLDGMIEAAQRDGLWHVVLPVTQHMSAEGRRRFTGLASLQVPEVLETVVDAAVADGLWPDLLPLAELLPPEAREVVLARAPAADASGAPVEEPEHSSSGEAPEPPSGEAPDDEPTGEAPAG
ncbi:MAG TPA: hypothetical protein VGF63_02565 [Solirubrobacteraceae bacterium]|jgi:hypothetical protein